MIKNSIFVKIFTGFLITIALFSTILLVSYNVGLTGAVDNWSNNSLIEIKEISLKILDNDIKGLNIPQDNPIFIYNVNKELIYSNRGSGRKNSSEKEFIPVYKDNKLMGYFISPKKHFLDSEANKQFTNAITNALIFAIILSTILVIFIALFVSGSISRPTKNVVTFLQELSQGEQGKTIKTKGTHEIQKIINAVNHLSMELARDEELRSQWARDIAHDLRTPVSALKAQFEGMSRGVLDINKKRVEQNLKEILRMEYLVEDLSELMKLEDPETTLYIDEIISTDFISQIKNISLLDIESKNITTEFKYKTESFIADEMLLYRAVSNIWVNAVRHTEAGGTITMYIDNNSEQTTISIINSGEIIPEKEIDKIFDRLFRGEKARNSSGSGLGLTISQKVINLHNGSISVTSSVDSGTNFTISLPN